VGGLLVEAGGLEFEEFVSVAVVGVQLLFRNDSVEEVVLVGFKAEAVVEHQHIAGELPVAEEQLVPLLKCLVAPNGEPRICIQEGLHIFLLFFLLIKLG